MNSNKYLVNGKSQYKGKDLFEFHKARTLKIKKEIYIWNVEDKTTLLAYRDIFYVNWDMRVQYSQVRQ